jgi:hypothetical protein
VPTFLRSLGWPVAIMLLGAAFYAVLARDAMPDVEVYHTAASRLLAGEPLYQPADAAPFTFMPIVALALAPLGIVDHDVAKFFWFTISVGLLTAFVRWAVRSLPERRRPESTLQWLTVAVLLPFYLRELTMGQTDVLLGVLLMGTLLAVQIELPRVAGVMLGIAIFIKPYALLLLPWLAFAHGARAAIAAGMVLGVGLVLPAAVFGWTGNVETLVAWFRLVIESESPVTAAAFAGNVSMGSLWIGLLGLNRAAVFLTVLSTTIVLGLVATVWVHRRTVLEPDYLECALVMLLVPLLSARAGDYTLLLATPAVVCLVDRWREISPRWRAVAGAGFMTMPVAVVLTAAGLAALSPVVTLAALLLAGSTANLRWQGLA